MDVEKLLIDNNIDYVSRGYDYLIRCLNPDHDDANPSMRIDKLKGIFGCYSCGFSGNIYTHFGIENTNHLSIKTITLKEKIEELMWSKPLEYPLDTNWFTSDYRNINASTFKDFNAFTTEYISELEGRLVIPILDINDRIISFNGRNLYSELNPRYKFFPSGSKLGLFPPKPKFINNSIILVEGIFDMLNLYDKGLTNAVCTFGTSFGNVKNKEKQKDNIDKLLMFKYQGVTKVYIMYDGDLAGDAAANSLKEYVGSRFNIEIIELEDGLDPGGLTEDYINELKRKLYG